MPYPEGPEKEAEETAEETAKAMRSREAREARGSNMLASNLDRGITNDYGDAVGITVNDLFGSAPKPKI